MTSFTFKSVSAPTTANVLTGSKAGESALGTVSLSSATDNSSKWKEVSDDASGGYKYKNVQSQLYLGFDANDDFQDGVTVKEVHGADKALIFMKRSATFTVKGSDNNDTSVTGYFFTPNKLGDTHNESLWLTADGTTVKLTVRTAPPNDNTQLWYQS